MADTDTQVTEGNAETTRSQPRFSPPTDIVETGEALILLLDMPGADADTLEVTLDRRVLNISAHSTSSVPDGYAAAFIEYAEGDYERRFIVSEDIDEEHIEAALKDGVLRLRLPKVSPSPAKKITVTSH